MQSANLIGNLTNDIELRYTSSGMAIGTFTIACNRKVKKGDSWIGEASFFDCKLWGKRAESLRPYLIKGTKVGLVCEVVQERWEHEGRNISKVIFTVNEVELLGSKPQQGYQNSQQGYQKPQQENLNNYETRFNSYDGEEIPF